MKVLNLTTLFLAPIVIAPYAASFQTQSLAKSRAYSTITRFEYVPDGFTAASYKKFKEQEAKKNQRNLGGVGPRGFKSRSMQSFQEAMERGEANHLMPVFNAKQKVASGKLKKEDIPVSMMFIINLTFQLEI